MANRVRKECDVSFATIGARFPPSLEGAASSSSRRCKGAFDFVPASQAAGCRPWECSSPCDFLYSSLSLSLGLCRCPPWRAPEIEFPRLKIVLKQTNFGSLIFPFSASRLSIPFGFIYTVMFRFFVLLLCFATQTLIDRFLGDPHVGGTHHRAF